MSSTCPDPTFRANTALGRHGWLRLTPAYAAGLVRELLAGAPPDARVLDPFAGTGTTALVAAEKGLACEVVEVNPFLCWFARAKTATYPAADLDLFGEYATAARRMIVAHRGVRTAPGPDMHRIDRWWHAEALEALQRLRGFFWSLQNASFDTGHPAAWDLLQVAFCRTLIATARVTYGHQSVSFREDRGARDAEAVAGAWDAAVPVVREGAAQNPSGTAAVHEGDARTLAGLLPGSFTHVVTSPPYCNRMSYIRELRPYLYWLEFLGGQQTAGDLDWHAIGGTWGSASSRLMKWKPSGAAVPDWLPAVAHRIAARSKICSRYVERYVEDMTTHVGALAPLLAPGARVHYVVGNSMFYGTDVPVQELLRARFAAVGLEEVAVRMLRARSSKKGLFEYVVEGQQPGTDGKIHG